MNDGGCIPGPVPIEGGRGGKGGRGPPNGGRAPVIFDLLFIIGEA